MSKKVLITGVTGFIGANLCMALANGYNLFLPNHSSLDLLDYEHTRNFILQNHIDIIIHCANTNDVSYDLSSYEILKNGLKMFYSIERCANYCEKVLYFGSGAEYGMKHYIPKMREEYFDRHIPDDPYGFAKYIEAKSIKETSNIYDLRLFGVYGKNEQWQRRFISNNIVRSLKGLPMTLSQNVRFDYLYVDDLCKIVEWFLEHEPNYKHYNICTGQTIDLLSLANLINEVSGLEREIRVAKEGWQIEYSGDNNRLLAEIGEFQFTDKKTSIEKMWDYYTKHIDEFDEKELLL